MSVLNLSDFRFLPDRNGWGRPDGRGDGGVVVPFDAVPFGAFGAAPRAISVVDRRGRAVVYTGGGPTYFADSEAGTKDFAGWSYFEDDDTEDLDGPCVQLFVLHPDYPEADYLALHGVCGDSL